MWSCVEGLGTRAVSLGNRLQVTSDLKRAYTDWAEPTTCNRDVPPKKNGAFCMYPPAYLLGSPPA